MSAVCTGGLAVYPPPPTSGRSGEVKRGGRVWRLWWCELGVQFSSPFHHPKVDFITPPIQRSPRGHELGLGQLLLADRQFGPLATVDPLLPDVSTMDHFLNPSVSAIPRPDLTIPRCKNRFTGIRQGKKNK